MIFVTQYKTDPRNTTYTKLAQANTGNTLYTKYRFLLSFFFRIFTLMKRQGLNERSQKYNPIIPFEPKKNFLKSLQIQTLFVYLSCWNSPTPKNPIL
jgi:hypothetical protein